MFIQLDESTNKVILISATKTKDATIEVTSIPTPTETQHLEYVNGRVVAVENVSNEELRQQAYEAEVDRLVIRHNSYRAEAEYAEASGETLAVRNKFKAIADGLLAEIAKKKAEIRERYPDS